MWKVAPANNCSIFYCACTKFITRLASKINHQVCHQMARVLWEQKKLQQLWSAMQDSCNALNWSRTGKSPFFKFIRPDFWMDLNGCWQRLLFARQLTQRKFSLCSSGTRSLAHETEGKIWSNKKIQFFWFARLWANDVSVVSYTCYGVCNSSFVKSSVLFK